MQQNNLNKLINFYDQPLIDRLDLYWNPLTNKKSLQINDYKLWENAWQESQSIGHDNLQHNYPNNFLIRSFKQQNYHLNSEILYETSDTSDRNKIHKVSYNGTSALDLLYAKKANWSSSLEGWMTGIENVFQRILQYRGISKQDHEKFVLEISKTNYHSEEDFRTLERLQLENKQEEIVNFLEDSRPDDLFRIGYLAVIWLSFLRSEEAQKRWQNPHTREIISLEDRFLASHHWEYLLATVNYLSNLKVKIYESNLGLAFNKSIIKLIPTKNISDPSAWLNRNISNSTLMVPLDPKRILLFLPPDSNGILNFFSSQIPDTSRVSEADFIFSLYNSFSINLNYENDRVFTNKDSLLIFSK